MGKKAEALHKSLTGQGLASRATAPRSWPQGGEPPGEDREAPVRGPEYEASQQKGQACRQKLPRSDLGKWEVRPGRSEAVDLIFQQDADRLSFLVPERHRRHGGLAVRLLSRRGLPMAADLSTLPTTGLLVQACGDAHIANFGGYRSPESHLVFDLNDFDETAAAIGNGTWSAWWPASPFAGRTRGFGDKWCREAVRLAARATGSPWRSSPRRDPSMCGGPTSMWPRYFRDLPTRCPRPIGARWPTIWSGHSPRPTSEPSRNWCTWKTASRRWSTNPPDIVPLSHFLSLDNQRRVRRSLVRMLDDYRATVRPPYQELLKNYRFIGAAQKVVGVGSVGTRCWVAAFSGNQMADPLVLQIKEANASVLERFCGRSPCLSHGERVVAGQRLMQTTSGVLLGWTHARDEHGRRRDYYVRQLWNWKMSVDLDHVSADELEIYGQLCAWTLARAPRPHGRACGHGLLPGNVGQVRCVHGVVRAELRRSERSRLRAVPEAHNSKLSSCFKAIKHIPWWMAVLLRPFSLENC